MNIALRAGGARIIIEFKRELQDSSFDALAASYAAQTVEYQAASIRLGFLVVLDLVKNDGGTPHIESLVHPRDVRRQGEDSARHIAIIR